MSHEIYQKVSMCAQQTEAPLSALPEALPARVDTGADSAQQDQAPGGSKSSHEEPLTVGMAHRDNKSPSL